MVRDKDGQLKVFDKKQLQLLRTRLTMVFQHFNLWSHMTVLENVMEAPVQVLGLSKAEAHERAVRYLDKVGIDERARGKYRCTCRAASSSVFLSPARWRWSRKCCCLTNRRRRWIPSWWARCCVSCRSWRRRENHGGGDARNGVARHVSNHVIFLHKGLIEERGRRLSCSATPKARACSSSCPAR